MKPLVSFLLLCVACGGAPRPGVVPEAGSQVHSAAIKAPGDAKVGDSTRCPVSGEEFVVKDDSLHADYEGKTYYFCCPHCVDKFKADPQKYLGKPGG